MKKSSQGSRKRSRTSETLTNAIVRPLKSFSVSHDEWSPFPGRCGRVKSSCDAFSMHLQASSRIGSDSQSAMVYKLPIGDGCYAAAKVMLDVGPEAAEQNSKEILIATSLSDSIKDSVVVVDKVFPIVYGANSCSNIVHIVLPESAMQTSLWRRAKQFAVQKYISENSTGARARARTKWKSGREQCSRTCQRYFHSAVQF